MSNSNYVKYSYIDGAVSRAGCVRGNRSSEGFSFLILEKRLFRERMYSRIIQNTLLLLLDTYVSIWKKSKIRLRSKEKW